MWTIVGRGAGDRSAITVLYMSVFVDCSFIHTMPTESSVIFKLSGIKR